jgi:EAL domain-containing protein (putative c-di-GMP-specific phosphodiesterase class I)
VDRQYTSIAEVLRDADTAMYHAKGEGRNRSAIFTSAMHEEALRRLSLRMHLRSAIEQHEFVLLYQPIVTLADGAVHAVEALLRWHHPEQGYLAPASFLPLAEEMGLMVPVGRFVLTAACSRLRAWQDEFPDRALRMNVNLSVQEVLQPDLPGFIAQLLEHNGIEPGRLVLEITETSILQSEQRAAEVLHQLKAVGVGICIDDFGTGYSSLRYIKTLPLDGFKIDRTFSAEVHDTKSERIIELLVRLGEACNLDVTVEGVETADQAERLLALGCTNAQGLYFHEAMPPESITRLLR